MDGFKSLVFERGVCFFAVDIDGNIANGSGKYIAVYRKQPDGAWLIDMDIFNYNLCNFFNPSFYEFWARIFSRKLISKIKEFIKHEDYRKTII